MQDAPQTPARCQLSASFVRSMDGAYQSPALWVQRCSLPTARTCMRQWSFHGSIGKPWRNSTAPMEVAAPPLFPLVLPLLFLLLLLFFFLFFFLSVFICLILLQCASCSTLHIGLIKLLRRKCEPSSSKTMIVVKQVGGNNL
jgi:hypothetical protein